MTRFEGELCDNILLGSQARLPTRYGNFRIHAFVCPFTGEEHVALVKGKVAGKRDVLVRLHSECVTGDVFGSERCDCGQHSPRRDGASGSSTRSRRTICKTTVSTLSMRTGSSDSRRISGVTSVPHACYGSSA